MISAATGAAGHILLQELDEPAANRTTGLQFCQAGNECRFAGTRVSGTNS
jgi:hypothetical protein